MTLSLQSVSPAGKRSMNSQQRRTCILTETVVCATKRARLHVPPGLSKTEESRGASLEKRLLQRLSRMRSRQLLPLEAAQNRGGRQKA